MDLSGKLYSKCPVHYPIIIIIIIIIITIIVVIIMNFTSVVFYTYVYFEVRFHLFHVIDVIPGDRLTHPTPASLVTPSAFEIIAIATF